MVPILYCAIPTRMRSQSEVIRAFAREHGFAPVIPFDIGSYEEFEGNPHVGRRRTLVLMLRLQAACDRCGVFGISHGVLGEMNQALMEGQPIRTFPGFDPQWDELYAQLSNQYGDPLARLRGRHELIVVAGPRAIGKTYWIDCLLREHRDVLRRVRTVTTREPRDAADHDSYAFVSESEFLQRVSAGEFLEHDVYRGAHYGSSLSVIKGILRSHHGVMALTPAGVSAVWQLRYECNVRIVRFVPADDAMVMRNLDRRGISIQEQRESLLAHARAFDLISDIPVEQVLLTGDAVIDGPLVHAALMPRTPGGP